MNHCRIIAAHNYLYLSCYSCWTKEIYKRNQLCARHTPSEQIRKLPTKANSDSVMSLFETTSSKSVISWTAYKMAEPFFLKCRFRLKRESISIFSQTRLYFLVDVVANISALSNLIGSLSKQDGEGHLKISLINFSIIPNRNAGKMCH